MLGDRSAFHTVDTMSIIFSDTSAYSGNVHLRKGRCNTMAAFNEHVVDVLRLTVLDK